MEITAISEFVPPPRVLEDRRRMVTFAGQLRDCGYNLANCAERLEVFPRLGVNFWNKLRLNWAPRRNDVVDTLIQLFIDNEPVALDRLTAYFPPEFVKSAQEMNLIDVDGDLLKSKLCLFPCFDKYIVTDRAVKNTGINQVMWLWGESFLLGGLVNRTKRRRAIDLGTGSGVHAILASGHCEQVVAVDVNPRAIEFAKFNGDLNGIENIEFVLSDLFKSVPGTCDFLAANPPYAPDTAAQAGDNFWSGGVEGTELLARIVEAIPTRVDPDGVCNINALYPNPPGTTISEHFNKWLGGTLGRYEVLDYTWPVPNYEDVLSEKPFVGDKSAWRFGVVSVRRSGSGNGWWREAAGRGFFFRSDGSCTMTADHDVLSPR